MKCNCGGSMQEHVIGDVQCFREKVWVKPRRVSCTEDRWMVDGHNITGTTLREQWGYYKHTCGNWSRPKDHESINSLK